MCCILQARSSGVFELRLKSFVNEYGKDSVGQCCSGGTSDPCSAPCRTMFRICLKHYQAKIDTTSPCTFGDVITPVLGDNSVNLGDMKNEGFNNPIRFNFDFTWPVSSLWTFNVSLVVVSAWKHVFFVWILAIGTLHLILCSF